MRKIVELIWHCTATPEGREVSVAEIDRWHKERGWQGIGYHYVVHLDGRVENGRPVGQIGAHVAGHNTGTVGAVYVGGVEADGKTPKDTRTPQQKAAMIDLTRRLIKTFGLKKVSGHHDYAAKACPCFPARTEYAHLVDPAFAEMKAGEAGVPVRDPATLSRSRTIAGAATATAGGAGVIVQAASGVGEATQTARDHFSSGDILGIVIGVAIVAAALWIAYARWDDAGRPLPWGR